MSDSINKILLYESLRNKSFIISTSPFSSFCGNLCSFHIDIVGRFGEIGVFVGDIWAERMGMASVGVGCYE